MQEGIAEGQRIMEPLCFIPFTTNESLFSKSTSFSLLLSLRISQPIYYVKIVTLKTEVGIGVL